MVAAASRKRKNGVPSPSSLNLKRATRWKSNEGDSRYKSKLLSMGLVRGVQIEVLQAAPLGDPIEVAVLSYRLSLRKEEANVLKLRRV